MSRRSLAAAVLVAAAGALPVLGALLGWRWFLDGPLTLVLAVAAGYAAGAWLPRVATGAGVLLAAAGLVAANQIDDAGYHWLDDLVFFLVVVGGPAFVASAVSARSAQVARLEALRTQLACQHRADLAAARLETRTQVHRDLHTGLAERIAGIALLAEGAQRSVAAGGQRSVAEGTQALTEVELEARRVLDELRAALGSLGEDDGAELSTPDPVAVAGPPRPVPGVSLTDVVVAAVIAVGLAVEAVVVEAARGPAWVNVLAAVAVASPLVLRRVHPVAAVAVTTAAATLASVWLTPVAMTVTGLALLTLIFYTVGAWCRGASLAAGWLVAGAGTVAIHTVGGWAQSQPSDPVWIVPLWAVAATLFGRLAGGWRERLRRTDAMVTAVGQGQGAALRLARARERQHLAGELHDTVAHAMTVVCLQAGAHRRPGGNPVAALATIADSAASSLTELRDGLDSIESSGGPLEAPRIVAMGRRVGVDVDVRGPAPAVAGPAAALALRVLREAIVNVARHAPGASAVVTLAGEGGGVALEVRDAGGGAGSLVIGSGSGLAGLAEAVHSVGGTLEWGPCRTGGFRVAARIPDAGATMTEAGATTTEVGATTTEAGAMTTEVGR